jgi:hypothetical protein
VKTITTVVLAAGLCAVAVAALVDPVRWLMPGHVAPAHKTIESDCLACHVPFRGTPGERCVGCHDPRALAPKVAGAKPAGNAYISVAELHRILPLDGCAGCHVGHVTTTSTASAAAFDHSMIPVADRGDCARCHRPPDAKWHPKNPGQCSDCHTTARWSPAQFDHLKYFP